MNPQSEQKRIAFGYNRGPSNQIEINEGQAAAVKLIFDWYCERKSLARIAELLTDMHVPTAHNRQAWAAKRWPIFFQTGTTLVKIAIRRLFLQSSFKLCKN